MLGSQEKLSTIIKTAAAIFAAAVISILVFQTVQFYFVSSDQKNQKKKILHDIMENKSKLLYYYVHDFSCWDEMVRFIEKPGYKWASENIDAYLTEDINVVWTFNKNFGLIYTVNNLDSDSLEDLPADKTVLKNMIDEKKLTRFYVKTKDGILEIQGASIHYTDDADRQSNPYGYLFAGRILGPSYITYISQVMGSSLALSTQDTPGFIKKLGKLKNLFIISKELEGLNGEKIGVLDAKVLSPELKRVFIVSGVFVLIFLGILIVAFIKLSSFTNAYLIKPLSEIFGSINKRSIEPIQFLQNEDNEFGEISKMIYDYFTKPATELTEEERIQRAIRESEERLRFLAENVPGFIVKDKGSKIIEVSEAFASAFGASKDKFIGKMDGEIWSEEVARQIIQNDVAALELKQGEFIQSEEVLEFEGRKKVFLTYRFVIPRLNSDPLLGILAVDITETKKQEDGIKNAGSVLGRTPVPVMLVNKAGEIEYVNDAFSRFTGYYIEEIKGQNPKILKSGETSSEEYKEMWETISAGNDWKGVLHNKKKSGELYWSFVAISPVLNEKGEADKYIAVEQDITEQKIMQDELKKIREMSQLSSGAKNEFLANLSHEIRTPLNSLVGVTDLLLDTRLTAEQKEYVSIFKRASDTLLTVVNDILDITKIESGEVQLDYVDFDIKDVVEKAVDVYSVRAQKKGVELKYHIAPDVVRAVVGDQARLRQILVNLLGNAMKFTEQGEIAIEVKNYKLQDQDALINFCVSDTGVGIPKDKMSTVFDSFAITDSSTTRKYGGSGLGLAIAKKLVELMGGAIWVESVFGQGSKFYFTVKLRYPDESIKSPVKPKNLKGVKILVTDEDDMNRTKIKKMLESGGAIVGEAEDMQSTFVELAKGASSSIPYSIAIVDSKIKEGGGFSFIETIRGNETFSNLKIILMLSERNQDTLNRVRLMDVKHVFKPVKAQPLVLSIENVLGITSTETEKKTSSSSQQPKKQLKILLVDDSEDTRTLTKRFLTGTLHILDIAENGTIAINKFMEVDYDLIFLDMHMPVMDGYNTVKAMRKYENDSKGGGEHVPIIALTADAFRADTTKIIEAGCDGHVVKPIRKSTLFEIIDKYSYSTAGK